VRAGIAHQYQIYQKLSERSVNMALLRHLDSKIGSGIEPAKAGRVRANLLRRIGDLSAAREAIFQYRNSLNAERAPLDFDRDAIAPPRFLSDDEHTIAPAIVIDDFLPAEDMRAIHRLACEQEANFVQAGTDSRLREGTVNPEKRKTLVTSMLDFKRKFFLDFLRKNLSRFQRAFGLPAFEIDRVEIKMTNHIDGGFFKTHADNHTPIKKAGRAITFLYYFGNPQPKYEGGDLYLIDSCLDEGKLSETWFTKVNPTPNRFVAFPSWYYHAVSPIVLPGNRFADGRFAISGHIRKLADDMAGEEHT